MTSYKDVSWDQLAEELAEVICDPRPEWTDNILLPTKDTMHAWCTDVEEDTLDSLCQREFEQVLVDSGSVGDTFGWYYNREIPLSLADAEASIEGTEEELAEARLKYRRWKYFLSKPHATDLDQQKFDDWCNTQVKKSYNLECFKAQLDKKYEPEEEASNMYTYLEMYIDGMSLGDLAVVMDILEQLKATNEISWYYYVQCGLAVSSRLVSNCPKGGWDQTLALLRRHNNTNHKKTVSYEDRFYGEMSFNMEDAIDKITEAKELAVLNSTSVEAMWYILMDQQELNQSGLPVEGYDDPLNEEHVDTLINQWELAMTQTELY